MIQSIASLAGMLSTPQLVFVWSWDGTEATASGGGWFRLSATKSAGYTADGGLTVITASGAVYRRQGVTGVDPAYFGAYGDGNSHPASGLFNTLAALQAVFPTAYSLNQEMDWLGVQAAWSSGQGVLSPKRNYIMDNANVATDDHPLRWVAGIAFGSMGGSTCNWSFIKTIPSTTQYVPNNKFTEPNGKGWVLASYGTPVLFTSPDFNGNGGCVYTDPAVANNWMGTISNGVLTVTDFTANPPIAVGDTVYCNDWYNSGFKIKSFGTGTGGNGTYNITGNAQDVTTPELMSTATGHYTQFGQLITLPPGTYRAYMHLTLTEGASYANGMFQPAAVGLGFNSVGPGEGSNPMGNSLYVHPSGFFGQPQDLELEFTFGLEEEATAYFVAQVGGYANAVISEISIYNQGYNCGVYSTRDGSPEHYPQQYHIANMVLNGPGNDLDIIGIFYNSYFDTDGNINCLSVVGLNGWGYGMDLRNGAYLAEFWQCTFGGLTCGILFKPGSINAGENFRFHGGGLANSNALVSNPGSAEFTFIMTTLDYSNQIIIQNAGRIECFGVHCEMYGPQAVNRPLWEVIDSGTLSWHGGMLLLAGDHNKYLSPPIAVQHNLSQFIMNGTQPYNLTCNTGMGNSGPGMVKSINALNTGNMNMGSFKNFVNDALGLAGDFAVQSSSASITDMLGIPGGLYSDPSQTVIDKWNSSSCTMEWSTDYLYKGLTRCIKVTRKNSNYNDRIIFAVPIDKWQSGNMGLVCMFPYDPETGKAATQENDAPKDGIIGQTIYAVYSRFFKINVTGSDAYGRLTYGAGDSFCGESDFHINKLGSNAWVVSGGAASYLGNPGPALDTDRQPGVSAPNSATHVIMMLDTESLPATSFYIGQITSDTF